MFLVRYNMYPTQTSLIPVHIALARFLEERLGILGNLGNYPYWYLGTTPFRYLTGPILPALLIFAHKFFPKANLFEIFWGVLVAFWAFGGWGVFRLVRELADQGDRGNRRDKGRGILAAVFYLFGPIAPFLFRFSDGLSLMAFSVVPWALLGYLRFLRGRDWGDKRNRGNQGGWGFRGFWGSLGLMVFVLLLDISVLPTLILGMAAVFLATTGWKKAEEKIKSSLVLLFFSFLVATVWYSPGYWWQLLVSPSFAGKPLLGVIGQLGQVLPTALAITLATVSSKIIKSKDKVLKFCSYWLFIFGCLTLLRFVADPDFWLDWSGYGTELQLGLAVLGGLAVNRFLGRLRSQILNSKKQICIVKIKYFFFFICIFAIYFLLFTVAFNHYILSTLQPDISQTVEYRIGEWLDKRVEKGERVFLSGTTVFWLNAFFDIRQVRGGKDEVSVHPDWREAAWEIREGEEAERTLRALGRLGITYLVVHTEKSREFWHDFVYPEKFEGATGLEKIYEESGDRIYEVR